MEEIGSPAEGGWDVPSIDWEAAGNAAAAGGVAYGMLTAGWEEAKTVWANTGAAGMSTGERVYATVGTAIASVVGVRQISDAWTGGDAVDGHVQSFGENVLDATIGGLSAGLTAFGIGVGVQKGLSKLRSKADNLLCFPAGTPVHASDGLKAIERIEAGDRVWSYDHRGLRWVERRVVEVFRSRNRGLMATIRVAGETIRATGGHPFAAQQVATNQPRGGRPAEPPANPGFTARPAAIPGHHRLPSGGARKESARPKRRNRKARPDGSTRRPVGGNLVHFVVVGATVNRRPDGRLHP